MEKKVRKENQLNTENKVYGVNQKNLEDPENQKGQKEDRKDKKSEEGQKGEYQEGTYDGETGKSSTDEKKSDENSTDEEESGLPDSFKDIFTKFAVFGDRESDGQSIALRNIDKWLRQAEILDVSNVIDASTISRTDTAIIFAQIARMNKRITFDEFEKFLEQMAADKDMEPQELIDALALVEEPGFSDVTTPITKGAVGESVRRMTDPSLYTGSHKERFDDEGHGRGKAGREDMEESSEEETSEEEEETSEEEEETSEEEEATEESSEEETSGEVEDEDQDKKIIQQKEGSDDKEKDVSRDKQSTEQKKGSASNQKEEEKDVSRDRQSAEKLGSTNEQGGKKAIPGERQSTEKMGSANEQNEKEKGVSFDWKTIENAVGAAFKQNEKESQDKQSKAK